MKRPDLPLLKRRALSIAALAASALFLTATGDSQTRTSVHPYLQIEQVLTADFNGGDVLTYTGVGGGIEATVSSRRVTATIAYDYQRRIAWDHKISDHDVHTGLAAAHVEAVPGTLSIDAGAIATRTHGDIRAPIAAVRTIDDNAVADVYGVYAGPTFTGHAGPVKLGAAYRLGYVNVDDHSVSGGAPAAAPGIQRYGSSTVQNATVSAGMSPGELPFGWTVGAGWVREDMKRFDSKFEGKYVRGDVVVPIGPTFAVTGGVGYESDKASQQDILRDSAGLPVIGPSGQIYADPSKPRLLTYEDTGLIWDAGVIWRPDPRTELQARVGHRYGGTTYTGSLEHRINESYLLTAAVFDDVSSFGRLLMTDLNGVPRSFAIPRDGLGGINGIGGLGGCAFGNKGAGVCFDDALQSVANFNFRNRGALLRFSGQGRVWDFAVGATYANRRYFAPPEADFLLHGVTDQSFTVDGRLGRKLSPRSGIEFDAFAGWYDSGVRGSGDGTTAGATAAYYRTIFGDRIQATAQAGVFTSHAHDFDRTYGSILFGLKYGF
jgi:hypothetical protein